MSVKKLREVNSYRPKVAKPYTEIIMENSGIARGNIARQANKKLRWQRILDLAGYLITSDEMEDFTIPPLPAKRGYLHQRFTTYLEKE